MKCLLSLAILFSLFSFDTEANCGANTSNPCGKSTVAVKAVPSYRASPREIQAQLQSEVKAKKLGNNANFIRRFSTARSATEFQDLFREFGIVMPSRFDYGRGAEGACQMVCGTACPCTCASLGLPPDCSQRSFAPVEMSPLLRNSVKH
jgi:hypothetical protein